MEKLHGRLKLDRKKKWIKIFSGVYSQNQSKLLEARILFLIQVDFNAKFFKERKCFIKSYKSE